MTNYYVTLYGITNKTVLLNDDIDSLTDIELLELLCSSNDDDILYEKFVKRFLSQVKAECERICKKRKLDSHIGQQIAHETFERLRKYKSFKTDQVKINDHNKAILAYLCRISSRLFSNNYLSQKNDVIINKNYFDEIFDSAENDIKVLQNKKNFAVLLFGKLNDKEKRIILVDIEYKKNYKYLPDHVIDSLSEELNIKRDTVRKIRERAILKIKNGINEINNQ